MSQPPMPPYPGGAQPGPQQPYPGQPQPYPGQPQQGQPYRGQPYQGGPYQGQPYEGHSPPYGQSTGYPSAEPAVPPKKSRAGKIILIVLAVLVVLCGGGAALAYTVFKDDVEGIVEASQTRLVAPDKLSGRPKITDAQLVAAANTMVAEMKKSVPGATSTVGAFYGDVAKQDMVMIAGASGRVSDPRTQLDEAVSGMGEGGLTVSGMKSVDPGPLGGVAKCGDAKSSGVDMGVCIWADNGSVGVVVIYFKTGEEASSEFVTIRGEIEQRS